MEGVIRHFWMVEDLKPAPYILGSIAAAVVLYSLYAGYKRWTHGGERVEWGPLGLRLRYLAKYALLQWRVVRHRFPGAVHLLIFLGMGWLLAATILRALDADVFQALLGRPLIGPGFFKVYKLLDNLAGLMVLAGSAAAVARRALGLTPNLLRDPAYYLVHAGFMAVAATGFLLDGMAAVGRDPGLESPAWDPVGYLVYSLASTWDPGLLRLAYRVAWVTHLTIAMGLLALIPYTNLWHIAASTLNVALARRDPGATARPVEDLEERIERGEPVGVVALRDTTWKQRLDFEACTSCMRCTNACPAFASGKPLDPRGLVVALRDKMLRGEWDDPVVGAGGGRVKVDPEAVWSCVTCGACVAECPVLINHVEVIIDLRRGLISMGSEHVPGDAQNALYNLMQQGNPFGFNPAEREEWLRRLAEKYGEDVVAREGVEYDYLYWVGCVASFDERIRPVAEAVIRLLRMAGLRVAVLPEEGCCGEPARRMGEEALFLEALKENLRILSRYKFKKLLVSCPHGYTVFKREYPAYRRLLESSEETKPLAELLDRLEVEHHTVALARLVREGRLKPSRPVNAVATYHDPCYLGRWNGVYDEPREILKSIPGLELREMPRSREKSFCCGGGGGQLFYEVRRGERLAAVRAREAAGTSARVVAVACPYCNTMLRGEAGSLGLEVRDVAELLAESVEGDSGGGG
ncbi:(Fe-S)-binding protein [Stetteria hydrogenophila]